ncbi:MAG: hypothetical protein QF752_07865 [Planctomycetota bacterium]|jgi:hypothetical protein|nr:hypothetical protein [Planctomycetota bacterium]
MNPVDPTRDEAQLRIAIGKGWLAVEEKGKVLELHRNGADRFEDLAEAIADLRGLSRTDLETLRKEAKMASLATSPRPAPSAIPVASSPVPVSDSTSSKRWVGGTAILVLGLGAVAVLLNVSSSPSNRVETAPVEVVSQAVPRSESAGLVLDAPVESKLSENTSPSVSAPPKANPTPKRVGSTTPKRKPPRASEAVVPPSDVHADAGRLAEWLLGLSESQFEQLAATPKLDRYVTRAMNGLAGGASRSSGMSMSEFMKRINRRIRSVRKR